MGKSVDMGAIVARNEKTRAVGNVKNLNARGDTIDALGRVVKPVTDKVNKAYSKTVGNRSAQVVKKPQQKLQPDTPKPAKIDVEELLPEELELEESFEDDLEIEKIKEEEIKKATKKK
jgi:DNA repair exonuclease SbcCD nuclease subunit